MSHQTGIRANDELRQFFGKCRDGNVRLIQVSVINEELSLRSYQEPVGTWEEDYDGSVVPLLEDAQPCYMLYRLDVKHEDTGYQWLLISWSPDNSPVREKMLYASTKATLKLEFGASQISEEIFGSVTEDVSLSGYHKHKRLRGVPAPLTFAEEELQAIRKNEIAGLDVGVDTKHQTIQGLSFPIAAEAIAALFDMRDGKLSYVQLSIDLKEELINLASTTDTSIAQLPRRIPNDSARYHLFRFPHTHEGDYLDSIVFIYSMPGYNCSIKERMLYSSCKSPLLEVIEIKIGICIAKRLEISEGKELTKEFLVEEIHPTVNIHRQKFAKPKGPPNRGARRITRPRQTDGIDDDDATAAGILV